MSEQKAIAAPAPKWASFKTAKETLEALWKYMGDNKHFGAWDSEPKYNVRDALRKLARVPETMECRWELFSSIGGVGKVNQQIAKGVNKAIALTKTNGFGAVGLDELWGAISHIY